MQRAAGDAAGGGRYRGTGRAGTCGYFFNVVRHVLDRLPISIDVAHDRPKLLVFLVVAVRHDLSVQRPDHEKAVRVAVPPSADQLREFVQYAQRTQAIVLVIAVELTGIKL